MRQTRRRLTALLMAVMLTLSMLTGNTGITVLDRSLIKEVEADAGVVSMSRILTQYAIPCIGRASSEGLWCIRVGGKKTFCLNSGKTMNRGDRASGKTHDAATYSNQSLAKVLTYYYGEKEQKGGTKLFGLCQAYVWACGKGANKRTAMIQAGKNIGVSAAEAVRVYGEIQNTDPYGKITYYTITKCAREKSGASHQHLLSWSGSRPQISYGYYQEAYTGTASERITVCVTKKDTKTGAGLAGAEFNLYRDDMKVATITTKEDGQASYLYTAQYKAEVSPTAPYVWVKNWNSLSAARQAEEKKKGYYSSEALAAAACIADLKPRAELMLEAQKKEAHTWKTVEVKAPQNHRIGVQNTQTKTEGASAAKLSFLYTDPAVEMSLELQKKSSDGSSGEGALKGAVYGLYAAENIPGTDNTTVALAKDAQAAVLVTDGDGTALAKGLLPGKYYLQELSAPEGFEKDSTKHSVDLTWTAGASAERKITVTDRPVKNRIRIQKTFAGAALPTKSVMEKQLRETYVPGACEHHTEHDEACGYSEGEEGQEGLSCGYFCDLCAYEEILQEKPVPITDAFSLVDARGETVSSFAIGDDGYGESDLLPCGTYILKQTAETEGYARVPDRAVTINDSEENILLSLDDPAEEARIYLTKYRTISDEETRTFLKEAETGAEFALYGPDEQLICTAKADAQGLVSFGELETLGTYRIHQISGMPGYQKTEDKTVHVAERKSYFVTAEDSYCGDKVRIQKYLCRDKREPEKDAEFVLLDAAQVNKTKEELTDMDTAEKRMDFLLELKKENPAAVIRELCTDSQGRDAVLLNGWLLSQHPEGFILLQIWGEEGYSLCAPVYSQQLKPVEESGIQVYEVEATDTWNDWASVSLTKYMTSGEKTGVPEPGAEFMILDENEQIADRQKTGEDGTVLFKELGFGTYRIEQLSGDPAHEKMEPVYVALSEKDRHQTVCVSVAPVVDREKEIRFVLTKRSEETGILLDGAHYELYRVEASGENEQESMVLLHTLCTGQYKEEDTEDPSGKASCSLPFGTYMVKEIYPADGYLVDEKEYRFTLDAESVSYGQNGEGTYVMELTDRPVMGRISLEKKGNVLTGYAQDSQSFISRSEPVSGAVYGLYAEEDICRDDGQVMYAADTLIDQKMTDDVGRITFTRTDEKGQRVDRFYLGNYYVQEISAPEGYTIDQKKHPVRLTWDNKTEQFNDFKKVEQTEDVEDPVGNNSPDPDAGKYVLETGAELNKLFRDRNVTGVTFTWEKAPQDAALLNVSSDKTNGIVLWTEGTECYISTQLSGQVMYFNAVSAGMFADCTALTDIRFANVDTSFAVDLSRMFYRCSGLTALDLSCFNMKKAEDVSRMFAYCTKLKTIYVNDQVLTKEELYEEDIPSRIMAEPKNDVMVGHTFTVDDFNFTMFYENGKSEEIYPTQTEAEINPHTADKAGELTVQIPFTSTGRYGEFGTIETGVRVLDPYTISAERTWHEPEVSLQMYDEAQTVTIQLVKANEADAAHEMLEGAEFTLYAGCDIVDVRGEILFRKDEIIASQVSGNSNFSYVEFSHLPSEIYKKDRESPFMYYVRETKAPAGYYGSDKTIYISGKTQDNAKAEFIYGYSGEKNLSAESSFVGSEEFLYENERIPYITLKKEWKNDNLAVRPDSVEAIVTLADGTVKNYLLKASENWEVVTDINADVVSDCTGEQLTLMFRETVPDGYKENGSSWHADTNTYTFRNIPDHPVSVSVEKIWDDKNNRDDLRPDGVEIGLYANEQRIKTVSLPDAQGEWSYTENALPAVDDSGTPITYTWKEVSAEVIQGDAKQGYLSLTETDAKDASRTVITNYHEVETVSKSVKKVWDDDNDHQKIRPDRVCVQLLADGKPVPVKTTEEGLVFDENETQSPAEPLVLHAENGWCETVSELPAYDGDREIVYTWQETEDDDAWITGEAVLGYEPSYAEDPVDPQRTILTNTHTYFAGASVKVNKKISRENLSFAVDEPTFVFTLKGTDAYGNAREFSQKVTFTKEEYLRDPKEEILTKSVVFTEIPMGTYTLTESGMEGIYEQTALECLTPGVETEGDGFRITVGPTRENSKRLSKNEMPVTWDQEVIFENKAVRGSVQLTKYKEDKKTVLPGVSFVLENEDASVQMTAVTDEAGKAVFEELKPGRYTLTETGTADGNSLLAEPVQILIPLDVTDTESEREKPDTSRTVQYKGHRYLYHLTYDVINDAVLKLPMTGYFGNWTAYLPIGAAGGVFLLGLWYSKTKTGQKKKRRGKG